MLRKLLVPIRKGEWKILGLMFTLITLINVNYITLRTAKTSLIVTAAKGGAKAIPQVQLFFVLPCAFALTFLLTRLMRRLSPKWVFTFTSGLFIAFFVVFAAYLYPYRSNPWVYSSFYTMAELWKVGVLVILFWGFLNRNLLVEQAKRFYAPLVLGGSLAAIFSGRLTRFCCSDAAFHRFHFSEEHWHNDLILLISVMAAIGVVINLLFHLLNRTLAHQVASGKKPPPKTRPRLSISNSLQALRRSPYLRGLALIVLTDYVAYSLTEIVFNDVLHKAFSDGSAYNAYLGRLTEIGGYGMLLTTLFVAPILFQRKKWVVPALITPIVFTVMGGAFFIAIIFTERLDLAVLLGSIWFCLLRPTKLGLLDPSKELAYVPLPDDDQVKGKLVIDGLVSRTGRAGSSVLTLSLAQICGSVAACTPYAAILVAGFAATWINATIRVGRRFAAADQARADLASQLVDDDVRRIRQKEARETGD